MAEAPRRRSRVTFVGLGPGVASLLTLAAVEVVERADLVLASDEEQLQLLAEAGLEPADARLLDGDLEPALNGSRDAVVLVDGDPFMDAQATARARDCASRGMEIDVIPGVPRKTSLAEFAGVALSDPHVQLITMPEDGDDETQWALQGTIVVIGAARQLQGMQLAALQSGRRAAEPALITVRAGSTAQQSRVTTVGELDIVAGEMRIAPTTTIVVVIGRQASADERQQLNWFESKPLFGWKVLVPRTQQQAGPLTRRLASYGAETHQVPTISVEPPRTPQQLDKAVQGLVEGRFGWVAFTSANAVRAVREKFEAWGLDARHFSGLRIAAVGDATRQSLKDWGLNADLMPTENQSAAGLAAEFPAYDELYDPINRVLVPKADIATEALAEGLTELGWEVEDVVAYRTVRAAPPPAEVREAIKTGQFDAVVFTSSSTVRNLVGIAGKPHNATVIAAIGPQTAATCAEHGLRVDVQAERPSALQLADALAEFAEARRDELAAKGKPVVRPSQKRRRGRQPAALRAQAEELL